MIVVDVNVLAYLLIPGKHTGSAERLLEADAHWAAPRLWRSELRNVLATYLRSNLLQLEDVGWGGVGGGRVGCWLYIYIYSIYSRVLTRLGGGRFLIEILH